MTKSKLRRREFVWLTCPWLQSSYEESQGTQTGAETGTMSGCCLLFCAPWLALSLLSFRTQGHLLRVATPTHINWQSRKYPPIFTLIVFSLSIMASDFVFLWGVCVYMCMCFSVHFLFVFSFVCLLCCLFVYWPVCFLKTERRSGVGWVGR